MEAYLNNDKLEDYLGGELLCREERQFAVFLYNVFLEKKRRKEVVNSGDDKIDKEIDKIVRCCLDIGADYEKLVIKDIYFEATLMRDYFEEDKGKSFNEKLFDFCLGWLDKDAEIKTKDEKSNVEEQKSELKIKARTLGNLGQDAAKKYIAEKYPDFPKKIAEAIKRELNENKPIDLDIILETKVKASFDIARMMMNATPDILVVFEIDNKRYARALECKYLSDEGRYKDVAGVKCKMQLFIQECIMSFCFGARGENILGNPHYPVCPSKGEVWGYKNGGGTEAEEKQLKQEHKELGEKLWERQFMYIYKKILEQPRADGGVINAGVKMIKFDRDDKFDSHEVIKVDESDEIIINIDEIKKLIYN